MRHESGSGGGLGTLIIVGILGLVGYEFFYKKADDGSGGGGTSQVTHISANVTGSLIGATWIGQQAQGDYAVLYRSSDGQSMRRVNIPSSGDRVDFGNGWPAGSYIIRYKAVDGSEVSNTGAFMVTGEAAGGGEAGSMNRDQLTALLASYGNASNIIAPPSGTDPSNGYNFFGYYYNAANHLGSPNLSADEQVSRANQYAAALVRYFPIVNGAITYRA